MPDVATARCVLWRDRSARLTVTLAAGKTRLHHAAAVAIRGGAPCVRNADEEARRDPDVGEYRCPIEAGNFAIEITETEARNDGSAVKVYGLETQVGCRVALPTPGDRDDGATTSFVLDRTASSEPRADVVRRSRDRLEMWKWKVESITQIAAATTRIIATRAGSTVAIELDEAAGDEGPVYTWSYRVLAGHVVGAHEVPGWAGDDE